VTPPNKVEKRPPNSVESHIHPENPVGLSPSWCKGGRGQGWSRLLLEVYYTPGVDEICRQVQRQLMRNELARLYHHRSRKYIPPRKLRRQIQ
jgi:hypothetical protein